MLCAEGLSLVPIIPEFRKKGRSGEYEIGSLLLDFANIASPEFDVGMDFYCELLEKNQPSGKIFWVQAKTTEKFNDNWSQHIEKKTIKHWLKQFYPVFIILFEKSSGIFYWISVQEKRKEWEKKLSDFNKTIEVVVNRSQPLKKNEENIEFKEIVNRDIVLANALHGVPHMIGEGDVRSIPILRLSEIARMNIRHRVRLGLNYLMADSWIKSNLNDAYKIAKLLATFDKDHYDHFLFLARICHQLGLNDEANENYTAAVEVCKRDKNWNKMKKPADPTIEEIIEDIEKEKNRKY